MEKWGEAVPVQGRGQILGPGESAIVYGDVKTWRTKVGRVRVQGRGAERRMGARGPWGRHWGWSGGNTVEEEGAEVREAWQEGKESEAKQPGKWGCTWGDVLPFHTLGIQLILA